MTAHTPWNGTLALSELTDSGEQHVRDKADISVCVCENPDFAARIVACVNYCEGIDNEMLTRRLGDVFADESRKRDEGAALRAQIQTLRAALADMLQYATTDEILSLKKFTVAVSKARTALEQTKQRH